MRMCWFMAMACIILVSAVQAEDKAAGGDQEKIQGTWVLDSGERGGKQIPDEAKGVTLTFEGNKVKVKHGDREMTWGFKLDASKKPKAIDVDMNGKIGKGIYELKGDTLKIAHGEEGDPRPKNFESKEGSNVSVVVLKRKKA
jgi:uncharacterized protein (TIGR03067 family)